VLGSSFRHRERTESLVVAVVLAPTDDGDTSTIRETVPEAGMNLAEAAGATAQNTEAQVALAGPVNVVGEKGYHNNESLKMLGECEVRSYLAEPDRGRGCWTHDAES
jgi:transposase